MNDDVQVGEGAAPESDHCPFCQAAVPPAATVCPSCKAPFPWSAPIRELKQKLVELSAAKAGNASTEPTREAAQPPHWTTIFLSIVGTALVAAQVAIFWQQTRLFRQQAEAANVDRAEKLRGRIGTNLVHGEVLRRFEDAFRVDKQKGPRVTCDEACQRVPLTTAYQRFVELRRWSGDAGSGRAGTVAKAGDDATADAAAAVLGELSDQLGRSIAELDIESSPIGLPSEKSRGWAQRLFADTLQPALLSCAIGQPVQELRIEAVSVLSVVDEELGVYVPAIRDEILILEDTIAAHRRWRPSATPMSLGAIRGYVEERDLGADMLADYTVEAFRRHFDTIYERIGKTASAFAKACAYTTNRDIEALERIEQESGSS